MSNFQKPVLKTIAESIQIPRIEATETIEAIETAEVKEAVLDSVVKDAVRDSLGQRNRSNSRRGQRSCAGQPRSKKLFETVVEVEEAIDSIEANEAIEVVENIEIIEAIENIETIKIVV